MRKTEWIEAEDAASGRLGGFSGPSLFHFFGTRRLSWKEVSGLGTVARLTQIHGDRVIAIGEGEAPGESDPSAPIGLGEGDAVVTDRPGILLTIATADCLPLLFFHPVGRLIGAAHAGWRGSVKGIARRVVRILREVYGAPSEGLVVAAGPAIGPCCYQVGEEVLDGIPAPWRDRVVTRLERRRGYLDLTAFNRHQLLAEGVSPGSIHESALCTSCYPDRFYSYRRDGGRVGNMFSGIRLESGCRIDS